MFYLISAYDNIADLLIENGAKLDAEMHNGVTALMLACECVSTCKSFSLLKLQPIGRAKLNILSENDTYY